MVRGYTTIEQSKKLLCLGLDPSSADMYYKYVLPKSDKLHQVPDIGEPTNALSWYNKGYTLNSRKEPLELKDFCIPCWSLTALLKLMQEYGIIDLRFLQSTYDNRGNHLTNVWCITFDDIGTITPDIYANNPLDAAFELIEQGHIKVKK